MSKNLKGLLLAMTLLAVLTACMYVPAETVQLQSASVGNTERSINETIKGYQQWTRVNPVPEVMEPRVEALCALVGPLQRPSQTSNPHRAKFITVYVNELGTKAMMTQKKPSFPQGSVIVKEKLPNKDGAPPELLTVMIKHEAGYNPENGDWEYMVLDGTGKEVQARGRLENCQSCHSMVMKTDFVYRNYLPSDAWAKLK